MNDYTLKDVCVLFHGQTIIWQGVSYAVPSAWIAQYPAPEVKLWSDRLKPHAPVLTAIKEQELFEGVEGDV